LKAIALLYEISNTRIKPVAKKADIGSKRLISLAPDIWVQWITQQSHLQVQDILNTEFQWIDRESDVLLKVYSPEIGEFSLLVLC
jgi:predicted transposase YdaD